MGSSAKKGKVRKHLGENGFLKCELKREGAQGQETDTDRSEMIEVQIRIELGQLKNKVQI